MTTATPNSPSSPPLPAADEQLQVVLVTAGYDHTVRFWNVVDGTCVAAFQHNESHINRVAVSVDKRFVAVAGNPCIRLYDVRAALGDSAGDPGHGQGPVHAKQQPLLVLEGHKSNVTAIGWGPVASAAANGQSSVHGGAGEETRETHFGGNSWLWSVSEDGSVRVWDLRGSLAGGSGCAIGKCHRELLSKHSINDACLFPDGVRLATVDSRGCLRVWDIANRECLFEAILPPPPPPLTGLSDRPVDSDYILPVPLQSVAVHPEGRELACCNGQGAVFVLGEQARTTPASPGRAGLGPSRFVLRQALQAHATYITRLCYSPDGGLLCSCSADGTARLFSATGSPSGLYTGKRTFEGHARWVWDAAFSADSAYLLTASSDGTARLWETARSTEKTVPDDRETASSAVAVYSGHGKAVNCIGLNDIP